MKIQFILLTTTLFASAIFASGQGTITGSTFLCSTYSANYAVSGSAATTGYLWTVTNGTVSTGQGTKNVTISFFGPQLGRVIQVTGNGLNATLAVDVFNDGTPLPISGPITVCPGGSATFTSAITSPAYTGVSWVATNNSGGSIVAQSNTSATVNFASDFTGGQIVYYAYLGSCGIGPYVTLNVTSSGGTPPAAAGIIIGSPIVIPGNTGITYQIPAISGVTGYQWSLPPGATIASGANTNSIAVNFSTGFTGGQIAVAGTTGSCNSAASSMQIVVCANTTAAGTITGSSSVCQGQTNVAYSIPALSNAVQYVWTLPDGQQQVTSTNSTVVNFAPNATSGSISVYGRDANGCGGPPSSKSITVNLAPIITQQPVNSPLVMGGSATFSVTMQGSGFTYQWTKNGSNISGATSASYSLSNLSLQHEGNYQVMVSGGGTCTAASHVARLFSKADYQTDKNFVISRTVQKDNVTSEPSVSGLSPYDALTTIAYFDGLGRPLQTVNWEASPLLKDLAQPQVYDAQGRESLKYLPFLLNDGTGCYKDISFKNDKDYTHTFYDNTAKVAVDDRPFSETIFEPSPLNRPSKDFGVGSSWSATQNNKFIEHQYLTNAHSTGVSSSAEKIIAWNVDGSGMPVRATAPADSVQANGFYYAGQLAIKVTYDEQRNIVRDYTNQDGKVILKKVQVTAAGASNLNGTNDWALTYYVYDDLGNLRFVFQPELSKLAHSSDTYVPTTDLPNWAFQYAYDPKGRMISKQVPGAQAVYMVYDNRDRLVMVQDGNLRNATKWAFTKYDALNRPVLTGIIVNSSNRTTMQTSVDTYYNSLTTGKAWYETYKGSTGAILGYDNASYPQSTSDADYLTVTYYDGYDSYMAPSGYTYTSESLTDPETSIPQETAANARVVGLVTGMRVKILGTTTWLRTVNYYDQKYRLLQSLSDHQKGKATVSNILDFTGRVVHTKRTYVVNSTSRYIIENPGYDHAGRLLWVKHNTNGAGDVVLVKNEYNELGQLVDKKLHSTATDGTGAKQSVDYRYNIRGWLTSMNNASLTNDGIINDDATDYFGMTLSYNTVDADLANTGLYNGNISAMKWSNYPGAGAIQQKGYTYTYDAMNRIAGSTFKEKTTSWGAAANNGFSETGYQYDLNGNLTRMQRNDKRGSGWMDDMTYNYGTQGNKLFYVSDAGDRDKGFVDGNTGTTQDYTYDDNGNMTRDLNKGIGTSISDLTNVITYNHLNLPETVTKGANNVRYTYDATGRKLSQVANYSGWTKQTDYIGELTFENDNLKLISHTEGRVVMEKNTVIYTNDGSHLNGVLANAGTGGLATLVTQNGITYIQVTYTGSGLRSGASFNGSMNVQPGERYVLRAKGYSGGATPVNFLVRATVGGSPVDLGMGASLPTSKVTESWVEQYITIPSGGTALTVSLVWHPVATGQSYFLNDFEIVKLSSSAAEYQYNLKDHLGNVRLTFTTAPAVPTTTASFEGDANDNTSQYLNVQGTNVVSFAAANHTTGGSKVVRMNQTYKTGPAKSMKVFPGDKIDIEVWEHHEGSSGFGTSSTPLTTLITSVAGVFGGVSGALGESGSIYTGVNSAITTYGTGGNQGSTRPAAYLNFILFDDKYQVLDAGWKLAPDVTFTKQRLFFPTKTITAPGYLYVWLSYDNDSNNWVQFDDFKITNTQSAVIQMDDYYPFGLTFNSWTRENTTPQDYKYNGKEEQNELGLGWLDYGARMYEPSIGRWMVSDPLAAKYSSLTNYAYVANNPVKLIDPDGKQIWIYYQEARTKNGVVQTDKKGNVKYKTVGVQYKPGEKYEGKNQFVANAFAALDKVQAKHADAEVISELSDRKEKISIVQGGSRLDKAPNGTGNTRWIPDGSRTLVWWDQYGARIEEAGQTKGYQSPALLLLHETVHGLRELTGDFRVQGGRNGLMLNNSISIFKAIGPTTNAQVKAEETFIIRNYETPAAVALGEYPRYDRDQASPELMQSSTSNVPK